MDHAASRKNLHWCLGPSTIRRAASWESARSVRRDIQVGRSYNRAFGGAMRSSHDHTYQTYAETNTGTRMASWPSQQPTFLLEANPTPPTPHTMFGPALHHIAAGSFETTPLTQYRWELVCKECMGFAYRTNSGPSNPTGNHSPPLTGPGPGPGTDNQGSRTLSNHHFYRFTKYHGHGQWGPPRETDAPGLAPGRTSDRRVPRPVEGAVGGDLVGVGRRAGASWLVGTS